MVSAQNFRRQGGGRYECYQRLKQCQQEYHTIFEGVKKAEFDECQTKAAEGDIVAKLRLAQMHQYGHGTKRNVYQAVQVYQQIDQTALDPESTVEQKDAKAQAQYQFGMLYKNRAVPTVPPREWSPGLRGTVERFLAPPNLAAMGIGLGPINEEYEKAIPFLEAAAEAGHPRAKLEMGLIYQKGIQTLTRGNKAAGSGGGPIVGRGEVIQEIKAQDLKKAEAMFLDVLKKEGPEAGEAGYHLGNLYLENNDPKKAEEYFRDAANRNHAGASYKMGQLHLGRQEYDSAKEWLEKGANLKYSEATDLGRWQSRDRIALNQIELGKMYENGQLAAESGKSGMESAISWYERAASDNSYARRRLSELESK